MNSHAGRPEFRFELLHVDASSGARRGRIHTPHGTVETPAFMPVGTAGSVKGLTVPQIHETGTEILLGNTYHLTLRPGDQYIAEQGGLHDFIGWTRPILTDSGGFQIFSLAQLANISDHGVTFRSHIDGNQIEISPERSIQIQNNLGSDIAMVLDQVPALPATEATLDEAVQRTIAWAARSRVVPRPPGQAMFGIVQGGLDVQRRQVCSEQLIDLDFDGYALGGLSVGESPQEMHQTVTATTGFLPESKPRYLMGVGRPQDLLAAIGSGIDLFDCVMPTRNGRNALAFTDEGPLRLRNARFRDDPRPLQHGMQSSVSRYRRSYIRHLFISREMLGPIILSLHNLAYYQRLMRQAQEAIQANSYSDLVNQRLAGWQN